MVTTYVRAGLLGLLGAAVLAGGPAAQGVCLPHSEAVRKLSEIGESRVGLGISERSGAVIELYVADETGTFTVLVTRPDGIACITAWGVDWMTTEEIAGEES